jgi:hypothetical protein
VHVDEPSAEPYFPDGQLVHVDAPVEAEYDPAGQDVHGFTTLEKTASQPDLVTLPSDCHSMSMIPVVDVTGLGMVEPEYASSRTFTVEH